MTEIYFHDLTGTAGSAISLTTPLLGLAYMPLRAARNPGGAELNCTFMINDIIQPLREPLAAFFYTQDVTQGNQSEQAVDLASDTVMYGLRREVMHDNTQGLHALFSGTSSVTTDPVTAGMIEDYTRRLSAEINVPANVARKISAHVIPAIVQAMISYVTVDGTPDPNRFGDLVAGDLGTLRSGLEAGMDASQARGLGKKATGMLGFGIGGRYDLSGPGHESNPGNQ
jgi:hypothetical protein